MTLVDIIYVLVLLLFILPLVVVALYEFKSGVLPTSTLPWVRKEIIGYLKDNIKEEDIKIAELGSGWGDLSIATAKNFPNASITGFEISPFALLISKFKRLFFVKNIQFLNQNFFEADLSKYNVLIAYLTPKHMERLNQKIKEDKLENKLLISNSFEIKGLEPINVIETRLRLSTKVYVYRL